MDADRAHRVEALAARRRRRPPGARRARAHRVGSAPHPGSLHMPYHDIHGRAGGHRSGPAGRGHLLVRPAQRGRSQPAGERLGGVQPVVHVADGGVETWARQGHRSTGSGKQSAGPARHGWRSRRQIGRAEVRGGLSFLLRGRSVDLNVICKNCGSEVSPYITECPYCGQRLRKRAPKLKPDGDEIESLPKRRRRRRRDRRGRLCSASTSALRHDRARAGAGGHPHRRRPPRQLSLPSTTSAHWSADGDWWRLERRSSCTRTSVTCSPLRVAVAIFGTSLERRYGIAAGGAPVRSRRRRRRISRHAGRGQPGGQRRRARPGGAPGSCSTCARPPRGEDTEGPARRRRDRRGAGR